MSTTSTPILRHDPSREDLAALELQVAERERALAAFKIELHELQTRYLGGVGALYEKLYALDSAIAEEEVRIGLRPQPGDEAAEDPADPAQGPPPAAGTGCAHREAPSIDLKRIFRDVAKAIHPDRAHDDAARYRRHSLMAEANRAYAERDLDRLRLILHAWHLGPEIPAHGDHADTTVARTRRHRDLTERLVQIDAELADLRTSAIGRLQKKIEDTRRQGWDLFAEMVREVRREIARGSARLEKLRRTVSGRRAAPARPETPGAPRPTDRGPAPSGARRR